MTEKEKLPVQDVKSILESYCAKHGLPMEVGCRGWITYVCSYEHEGETIGEEKEGNKGWMSVLRDADEPAYTNVGELIHVVSAWIDDDVDETTLNVETDDGEGRMVEIINEESDGKSWEFEPNDDHDMEQIYTMIRDALEREGDYVPDDDDELDIREFLWSHCEDLGGESYYSTTYGVAWLTFDSGITMGIRRNADGELYIYSFDGNDVNKDTIFE